MEFVLAFISIFVAVDPIGLLPIFFSLTHELSKEEKRKIILQSMITALTLAIAFVFLGKAIFNVLGITISDFMIAGGIILFSIAIMDLLSLGKDRHKPSSEELGAVPIGTPLVVGPGVLTSSLMMVSQYGLAPTLSALVANILLTGVVFIFSERLIKILGQAGARALSKVVALLLAAIAIMMIRKGITNILMNTPL